MRTLLVEPGALRLSDLRAFASGCEVALSEGARANIRAAHAVLADMLGEGRLVYGANTGFGPLSSRRIDGADLRALQRRVVLSNAAGTGAPLAEPVVRRAMLLKLATFAVGASGVGERLADALLFLLNAGITPVVHAKGSVGASGDLAPLAHIGAALVGEGEVFHRGARKPAAQALHEAGGAPIELGPKEGLALVNGNQVSLALAVEGLIRLEDLLTAAVAVAAMSLEAGSGSAHAFDERIQALRNQRGQADIAAALRTLLADSPIQADRPVARVQDPYCLRCTPQVLGPVLDQLRHAGETLAREVNGVSDNPLIDVARREVLYGGNFHAQAIGMAADAMAMGFAEIGSISERRTAFLVDAHMSGLPAFLVAEGGVNSGFMVAQVTAAALACENKFLAHPVSTDSLPTAANLEDHVSMATHAARRLGDMAENLEAILAIELLAAAQGLDLRRPATSSPALEALHGRLRERVAPWTEDRFFAPDIAQARHLIATELSTFAGAGLILPSAA